MKKILFALTMLLCIFGISCNNSGSHVSPATQKNLDASKAIGKAFETKDFSKIGDYIAEDCIDHSGDSGDIKGLAAMKAQFEKWSAGSENTKAEIIKELADDEYVMSWMRFTGTDKTGAMGVKPGEKYDMKAIELTKFKDGKAVEHWTFIESGDIKKMMGAMMPPSPAPALPDSIK